MTSMLQKLAGVLAVGSLLGSCAHAPASNTTRADGTPVATVSSTTDGTTSDAPAKPKPMRVMVTGSRLPYYVEPGSQVLPTFGPISVYGRDAILSTGREDLGEALRALDPSITTHR